MKERAGIERDVGELAEGNIGVGARRRRIGDLDGANGVDAAAEFGIEPDRQVELPVALQHGGRGGAAERGLHHGIDVAGIEAVARGLLAIDLDVEIGLAEQVEYAEIGDAADLAPSRP